MSVDAPNNVLGPYHIILGVVILLSIKSAKE